MAILVNFANFCEFKDGDRWNYTLIFVFIQIPVCIVLVILQLYDLKTLDATNEEDYPLINQFEEINACTDAYTGADVDTMQESYLEAKERIKNSKIMIYCAIAIMVV